MAAHDGHHRLAAQRLLAGHLVGGVDGDGRRKPLWYALRDANAPRMLTVQPRDGHDVLAVVNETPTLWRDVLHLSRQLLDGTVLAQEDLALTVGAWSVAQFALPASVATPDGPRARGARRAARRRCRPCTRGPRTSTWRWTRHR